MKTKEEELIEYIKTLQKFADDVKEIMYSTAASDFIETAISIINEYPIEGKLIE